MKKRIITILISVCMSLSLVACTFSEEKTVETETISTDDTETSYTNYIDQWMDGNTFDISAYYNSLDVESSYELRATGGIEYVLDDTDKTLPVSKDDYIIGFSIYNTWDESSEMLLNAMKSYAKEAGVTLKVNDANNDQNVQNQAIKQWIQEKIDGVIIAPCDMINVESALDDLAEAGIPCVTFNPVLVSEADSVVMAEGREQGIMAAQLLLEQLLSEDIEMKGTIICQMPPFVHPDIAARLDGFKSVFHNYPDVTIVELVATTADEHEAVFETALMAYPDMLGACGFYSPAAVGMNNAKKLANSNIPFVSINNDKMMFRAVYEGSCLGSVCYSVTTQAYYCMDAIIELANGNDVPSIFFCQNQVVTKENVEEMFEHYYAGKSLADYMKNEGN